MPTVYHYMTSQPMIVQASDPMTRAHKLMREHGFRHLPVLSGGKLVGIISDRDLHLLESLRYEDPDLVTVAEAMTLDPIVLHPLTPLDEAIARMSKDRVDAIIVRDHERVVGIFTASDALYALTDLLRRHAA